MKTSKVQKIAKVIKILLILLLLVGVAFIGVCPLKQQSVSLKIYCANRHVSKTLSPEELNTLGSFEVYFPNFVREQFSEIRITRFFKSIAVDKIQASAFDRYIEAHGDNLVFNQNAINLLRKNSASAVMERLIIAESLFALVLFLIILVNAITEKLSTESHDNHGPIHEIGKFCSEVVRYSQYIFYAARADLKAEVANSYLNRLWWVLEPTFNMLVYVIVFGRVMGNSIRHYSTSIYSTLLMWNFFSKILNYSVKCIRNNRDIVTKVYLPKHVLLITNMVLNFLKLLFSLVVLIPMLIIFKVHIGFCVFFVIPPYILMILLSFGLGMIFLHFGVYIDDLAYAVGILLQMVMFLSGIFYDVVTSLPTPLNTMMLCVNPVSMFIDTMRNALLSNIVCNIPLIILWTVISILLCYIGIHIVYKNENGYVKVV